MQVEQIGGAKPVTFRIPQLAGVSYQFDFDASGRLVSEVEPAHVRFFLIHKDSFRGLAENGRILRVRRSEADADMMPPIPVDAREPDVPRGTQGDKEDLRIGATNVDNLSNSDMILWAQRRRIAWRNKRSIADYAARRGLHVDFTTRDSVFQVMRSVIGAERNTMAAAGA
jgi:hypothetical protein